MRRLHLDWETRSAIDLRKVGVYVYAEHPTTFIWLCRYRFEGEDEVKGWSYDQPFPAELINHVAIGGTIVAHNATFERVIWNTVLPRQLGYLIPPMCIEQTDCTMSRALAMGLPASLEEVANILNTTTKKDMKGASNMKSMARPRKRNEDGSFIWWDEPDRLERLWNYCGDDVLAEEGIDAALPALSSMDRKIWELDQRMNERGIHLDINFIVKAQHVVNFNKDKLNIDLSDLTHGALKRCTERGKLVEWLHERGHLAISSLAKATKNEVEDYLCKSQDTDALMAVSLYHLANKSSTAKLAKMEGTVCKDGRSKGTMQCHGAFTGRWAGRLWQPQNLKRTNDETDLPIIAGTTDAVLCNDTASAEEIIAKEHGDVADAISLCVRSVVCAADNKILIGADYSNVEGRIIAWLAGAQEKLKAFAEQDLGGPDMYKLSYISSFGGELGDVDKTKRQIGKVQELALGYQGSIGAFINMAGNYGIHPEQISSIVLNECSQTEYEAAALAYEQPDAHKFDLSKDVWCGLKIVVNNWRNGPLNKDIAQFWWDLQDSAYAAVMAPGIPQNVGKTGLISYIYSGGYLWCRLPGDKVLAYSNPEVRVKEIERIDKDGRLYTVAQNSLSYTGWDGAARKWKPIHLYGGLQANHVTQGTAAVIMKRGMLNLEAGKQLWADGPSGKTASRSYPIILTVHDEALSEISSFPDKKEEAAAIAEYEELMLSVGNEFAGLPLAAKGWADKRYVK